MFIYTVPSYCFKEIQVLTQKTSCLLSKSTDWKSNEIPLEITLRYKSLFSIYGKLCIIYDSWFNVCFFIRYVGTDKTKEKTISHYQSLLCSQIPVQRHAHNVICHYSYIGHYPRTAGTLYHSVKQLSAISSKSVFTQTSYLSASSTAWKEYYKKLNFC